MACKIFRNNPVTNISRPVIFVALQLLLHCMMILFFPINRTRTLGQVLPLPLLDLDRFCFLATVSIPGGRKRGIYIITTYLTFSFSIVFKIPHLPKQPDPVCRWDLPLPFVERESPRLGSGNTHNFQVSVHTPPRCEHFSFGTKINPGR